MNSNFLIHQLNKLEEWLKVNKSTFYLFPLTIVGYLFLFLMLILSNLLAIIRWPIVSIKRRLVSEKNHSQAQILENAVNEVNAKELEQILQSEDLVLIDFWAEWCGPCIMMNKPLTRLAESDNMDCTIVKIDTMKHKEVADQYNIKGLPTLLLVKNNDELKRYAGALSYQQLKKFVDY